MYKLIVLVVIIGLAPSASEASSETTGETKTLLEKISSLEVFKLRLPYSLQRAIKKEAQSESKKNAPDSCQAQAKPHQRGGEIEYSCNPHNALKQELTSVAINE